MEKKGLTKEESFALKGIAILLMLFLHCFGASWWYAGFSINFFPLTEAKVIRIVSFGGICVGIFAFISGYGLSAALDRHKGSSTSFCLQRYVKSMRAFWPILAICLLAGVIVDNHTAETYLAGGVLEQLYNLLIQVLGLSYLFGTPMFVHEWWYLSAMVLFIFLTPVLVTLLKQYGWAVTMLLWIAVPRVTGAGYGHPIYGFSITLLLGIIFHRYQLFERMDKFLAERFTGWRGQIFKSIVAVCVLFFSYKVYVIGPGIAYDEIHAAFIPLVFILCVRECVLCYPYMRRVFAFLGKHSANMYFIHTVFSTLYLHRLLFSLPWFVLTPLALCAISLCFSLAIEWGKKAWKESAVSHFGDADQKTLCERYDLLSWCRSELMGAALLCVIMFHAVNLGLPMRWLNTLWGHGFLGVDVFIFLSSMGLSMSLSRRKQSLRKFYTRRLIRILPAYWLVAGCCGLFLRSVGEIGFREMFWTLSTLSFWARRPDLNYFDWYIPALLALYLVMPACYALLKRVKYRLSVCAVFYVLSIALANSLPYTLDLSSLIYRIPVFLLGIIVGLYIAEGRSLTAPKVFLWGCGLLAAPMLNDQLKQMGIPLPAGFQFALYGVFVCLLAARLLLCLPAKGVRSVLRLLGESSLEIYLFNVVVVLMCHRLARFLPFEPTQAGYHAIVIPGNILLGIGLHKSSQYISKWIEGLRHSN